MSQQPTARSSRVPSITTPAIDRPLPPTAKTFRCVSIVLFMHSTPPLHPCSCVSLFKCPQLKRRRSSFPKDWVVCAQASIDWREQNSETAKQRVARLYFRFFALPLLSSLSATTQAAPSSLARLFALCVCCCGGGCCTLLARSLARSLVCVSPLHLTQQECARAFL